MSRFRLACLACSPFVVLVASTVAAGFAAVAPPQPGQQAIAAQTVVVGEVTRIEGKDIFATNHPKSKVEVAYSVAIVKIDKTIKGAKGQTHVRVGFIKPRPVQPSGPVVPGRPILPRPRLGPTLAKGQTVCLFLIKHHKENFHTFNFGGLLVANPKNKKVFDSQVAEAENALKVMANPTAALKTKKIEDRLNAVAVVLSSYNTYPQTGGKVERVVADPEQSKLIVETILEADWNKQPTGQFGWQKHPRYLFNQLQVRELGYQYPRGRLTMQQRDAHMKDWLKKNAEKIRLKKNKIVKVEKE